MEDVGWHETALLKASARKKKANKVLNAALATLTTALNERTYCM
jgi:hypothetical protein